LEVETYTWTCCPRKHGPLALTDAIARELRFCMHELGVSRASDAGPASSMSPPE